MSLFLVFSDIKQTNSSNYKISIQIFDVADRFLTRIQKYWSACNAVDSWSVGLNDELHFSTRYQPVQIKQIDPRGRSLSNPK